MTYENVDLVTLIAGEDLRDAGPVLLKIENDGGVGKVVKTTAVSDIAIGILAENPSSARNSDGYGVSVALLSGKMQMITNSIVTAGQVLAPSTSAGRVYGVVNSSDYRVGVALESAQGGDIIYALAQFG